MVCTLKCQICSTEYIYRVSHSKEGKVLCEPEQGSLFCFTLIGPLLISGDYVIALFDKCCTENMKCTRDNILANICTFIELKWVLTLSFMLCNNLFNTWAQYCTLDVCISFKSFYFMVFFTLVYLSCGNMGQRTHRSGMNFFLSFCDRLCHSPI